MQLKAKRTLLILTLGVFGIINTEMGVIGILPAIAKIYGVSVSAASLLVSVFALVVAIAGPTMPLALSKTNRKTVMLLSMAIFVASNVLSAFAPNFTVLLVARAVPALFQPAFTSIAFTVAASSVPSGQSAKAVAKVFIGVSAGMVLGVPLANFLTHTISYVAAMLAFAAINLIVLIAIFACIPSLPVAHPLSYGSQLAVLKHPDMLIAILAVLMLNGATFGFFSYMSDFLEQVTRLQAQLVSFYLLIYGLMNILGAIIAGNYLTRNVKRSAYIVPIGQILVMGGMFFLGHLSLTMFVLIVLLGILAGFAGNVFQYLITAAGKEAVDFSNGLFLTATNLGTTIAPFVCGLMINAFDTRFALVGAMFFSFFGLLAIFFKYHYLPRKKQL